MFSSVYPAWDSFAVYPVCDLWFQSIAWSSIGWYTRLSWNNVNLVIDFPWRCQFARNLLGKQGSLFGNCVELICQFHSPDCKLICWGNDRVRSCGQVGCLVSYTIHSPHAQRKFIHAWWLDCDWCSSYWDSSWHILKYRIRDYHILARYVPYIEHYGFLTASKVVIYFTSLVNGCLRPFASGC